MRVLVTGGAGFIGSEIVRLLADRGDDVRVLDSLRADAHGPDARAEAPDGVEVVVGDVGDRATVDAALAGVDVVCHQAAKVGLGVDFADSPDYVASNVLATSVLLAAMADAGVTRLVQASSMVVYGEGDYTRPGDDGEPVVERPAPRRVSDLDAGVFEPPSPVTGEPLAPTLTHEDSTLDPRNVYALTKLAQEHLASAWCRQTGGVAASLRYHNVYGPGMPFDTPYAGVASLFRSALERGEVIRVFEDGEQRRDFVHVADVAAADVAAIDWTARAAAGTARAFNIGSGVVHTIGDLGRELARLAGAPEPLVTGEYRMGDVRHITASSSRARSELAWTPRVTFEEGMAGFADAPLRGR